jgi:NAD(P)-dependent dehydrogenase (short-subunit alcohol dehydrogenase family)
LERKGGIMQQSLGLSGKVALITGAGRGIGAATARVFAAAGANVALASRTASEIETLAAEIGPAALPLPCDVANWVEVEAAVAKVVATFGSLDVLVNNAGTIAPMALLTDAEPDAWGRAVDVNLKGVFHGMRAALPVMLAQESGTILNISSGAAHGPVEGWSAYCASKAGAFMLTRMGHNEVGASGIRVLGLSPGTVATDMQRVIRASGIGPVAQLEWSAHIPPEWPARTLLWMCSPDADDFLGTDVSLRDPVIRARVGLA